MIYRFLISAIIGLIIFVLGFNLIDTFLVAMCSYVSVDFCMSMAQIYLDKYHANDA